MNNEYHYYTWLKLKVLESELKDQQFKNKYYNRL